MGIQGTNLEEIAFEKSNFGKTDFGKLIFIGKWKDVGKTDFGDSIWHLDGYRHRRELISSANENQPTFRRAAQGWAGGPTQKMGLRWAANIRYKGVLRGYGSISNRRRATEWWGGG